MRADTTHRVGGAHQPPGRAVPRMSLRASLTDRARALATPHGAAGSLVEAVWAGTHLACYPFGARPPRRGSGRHGYRMEHLTPVQRGMASVAGSGTPILLLHGMADNHSAFALLRRNLLRRGFTRVFAMNYSVRTTDVRTAAAQLAEEVEAIVEETGFERIHVVAHSLGGIIGRYYVTRLGGDERVHTLITLGSPHQGSYLAHLLPTRLARQLRPGSALLEELNAPVDGCRTRVVAFWSDADEAVLPSHHAALEQEGIRVTNVPLHGVGHLSLLILPGIAHRIARSLTQLDQEGEPTQSTASTDAAERGDVVEVTTAGQPPRSGAGRPPRQGSRGR